MEMWSRARKKSKSSIEKGDRPSWTRVGGVDLWIHKFKLIVCEGGGVKAHLQKKQRNVNLVNYVFM